MAAAFDRASFSVQDGEKRGTIEFAGDTLTLRFGSRPLAIKTNYIAAVEKNGDLPLSKVSATLVYYDMFGNKENVPFVINETDFRALKKRLGK